jgi:hypothetical protein
MKRTFTQQPIIPSGYTGRNFNNWQKYLQKQIEKITRPNMNKRDWSYDN